MNLTPIKANMTELVLNDYRILFSYKTPVAVIDRKTGMAYETKQKWSGATTRHINQFLGTRETEYKDQEYFDNLIKEVK